jgi:hypothetical protein
MLSSLLSGENFADAARRAEERHQLGAGDAVLVHEVPDQVGGARRPARPSALLILI